ncbi:MAG: tyrosine--tRNA ligase [Tenericutes bacterium]|nr:tyrosine--tRNA ligase [Mycoplasmatota bacterium]
MKLFDELKWRGLVDNITSEELIDKINEGGLTFYIGVDPTADSLHIGHYSSVIAMTKRLLDARHHPIIIAGGGTGLIGDPKPNLERPMISKEAVLKNIEGIKKQLDKILGTDIKIINNADWLLQMNAIDFLRDYGKHFNINYMLSKDTVKRRLDLGITYTEFSYMILQSIDFLKLYEKYGVTLQIGGQDQWGNITSGLELIRKIHGIDTKCYGMTMPLITRADGTKFGKSESGKSVWLDASKTSPYEMYQFFINTEDSKVIEYLKKLTFLSPSQIDELETSLKEHPEQRLAQKALAESIITFVHSKEDYEDAVKITEALFNNEIKKLNAKQIAEAFQDFDIKKVEIGEPLVDLLIRIGASQSKREAKEFITNGAITINDEKYTDVLTSINDDMFIYDYLIIKRGKKNYYIASK